MSAGELLRGQAVGVGTHATVRRLERNLLSGISQMRAGIALSALICPLVPLASAPIIENRERKSGLGRATSSLGKWISIVNRGLRRLWYGFLVK
jgi:hypothetical protein